MSETSSQEPTMEEILASIRRIISEDETPAEGAAAPGEEPAAPPPEPELELPAAEPEPVAAAGPAPAPIEDDDDDDLELTQKVETHGDLDVLAPEPAEAPPPPMPLPEVEPATSGLVSDATAAVAASAFGRLSANIIMPAEGRTLEDVVRELLRPLLQQWLDDNLPGIVQQAVDAEVDRIARGRR